MPSYAPRRGHPALTRAATQAGLSVLEEHQVDLAKALGVGDQVDFEDLPASNREAEYYARSSNRNPYGSHDSVHKCRFGEAGTPCDGVGHARRPADLFRCAHLP